MEFGMKRVVASVQVVAILNRIYNGSPVSIASISKESKLSVSYLEQISRSCAAVKSSPASVVLVAGTTLAKQTPAWLTSFAPLLTRLIHLSPC